MKDKIATMLWAALAITLGWWASYGADVLIHLGVWDFGGETPAFLFAMFTYGVPIVLLGALPVWWLSRIALGRLRIRRPLADIAIGISALAPFLFASFYFHFSSGVGPASDLVWDVVCLILGGVVAGMSYWNFALRPRSFEPSP